MHGSESAGKLALALALALVSVRVLAIHSTQPVIPERYDDIDPLLSLTALTARGFGAEVSLAPELGNATTVVAGICAALAQHSVLVFRGLGHRLSLLEHVAFCKQFSVVDPEVSRAPRYCTDGGVHVSADTKEVKAADGVNPFGQTIRTARLQQLKDGEPPEVFKVVTDPNDGLSFGEGFHTDLTFMQAPPSIGMAIARLPSSPGTGDTLFLSMTEAYASLPPANRSRIANLWGIHDDNDGRRASHPVVRVVDNRTVLFVNGHFTRTLLSDPRGSDLHGAGGDGGYAEVLSGLKAHIESMEPLHIEWSEQDAVMWDERTTQHAAVHDYFGQHRRLDRVLVSGDVPVGLRDRELSGDAS